MCVFLLEIRGLLLRILLLYYVFSKEHTLNWKVCKKVTKLQRHGITDRLTNFKLTDVLRRVRRLHSVTGLSLVMTSLFVREV